MVPGRFYCCIQVLNLFVYYSQTYPLTFLGTVSRKIFDTRDKDKDALKDHDVDKYKRRGAVQWFSRWFG